MPAQSKAQQRFMGMVHSAQKGDMENPSPEVQKAADSMSDKDAKDFASTSHKGLPDYVKEYIIREVRGLKTIHKEYGDVVDQIQKHLELYKQTKGTPQEKQHIQHLKQLNDKKKELASELDQKISGIYKDAELKVDEMNVTGNVDGYGTPFAFGKKEDEKTKGKRQADLTGYSVVKESLIKEDIDTMYLVVALIAQLGALGQLGFNHIGDYERRLGPIDSIKQWWKDKKDDKAVKSIIAKIKSDPEMIEFFKLSQNQQKGKFRKLIATKLSGDEIQYLNRINKSDLQENRWVALIKEATANANILGIDFNISETDFRIFFAFKDKKEASIKVRQIGSNKIVNLIQNSLDKAYGKGEFFFRSGTNSEMQNGYLFQKKENNIDLSKLKFESNKSISENRWVALRQEDSTPTQKIGRGISNIHKQLKEMEQFLSWYGKIKNENGVSNKNFWKRTNSHIYNIKERLLKLDQQIRKISE
jgi:hypothetical protein